MADQPNRDVQVIREVAATLNLIGDNDDLKPLDSLSLIDFVVMLEERLAIEIPVEMVSIAAFSNIAAVARLTMQARTKRAG